MAIEAAQYRSMEDAKTKLGLLLVGTIGTDKDRESIINRLNKIYAKDMEAKRIRELSGTQLHSLLFE